MNAYTYLFTFPLLLMYSSFPYFHGVSSKGQNTLKLLTINISVNILKSTNPTAFDGNNTNTNSKYTKLGIHQPGPLWTFQHSDLDWGFLWMHSRKSKFLPILIWWEIDISVMFWSACSTMNLHTVNRGFRCRFRGLSQAQFQLVKYVQLSILK